MSKNIINVIIGGRATTITLPESTSPNEIVLFGANTNTLAGSSIFVNGGAVKNVSSVGSLTFDSKASNPAGADAVWLNGSTLYLGANPIGGLTLAPVGAAPNANAATVAGLTLNLQPADATNPGVITAITQTIGGEKTFVEDIIAEKCIDLPQTVDGTVGCLRLGGEAFVHSYGDSSNVFIGPRSCIDNVPVPFGENTSCGNDALSEIIEPAQLNAAYGSASLSQLTTGASNSAFGANSLAEVVVGERNTAHGTFSLANCLGSRNTALGFRAGIAVEAGDDTINIGTEGFDESAAINIGTAGVHTTTRIVGIAGTAPGGTPQAVTINPATHQLGSQAIPAVVTLATPAGTTPDQAGATLVGGVLTLQAASATSPGLLTPIAQTIAGAKTLTGALVASSTVNFPAVSGNPGGTPQAVIIDPATGRLGAQAAISLTKTTGTATATLNSGATITTMTVRGVSTTSVTANFTKMDNAVFMTLPQMSITAMSGAPQAILLNALVPAGYRPTNTQKLAITVHSGGTYNSGGVDVNSGTGNVLFNKDVYTALTTPCGLFRDTTVSWLII